MTTEKTVLHAHEETLLPIAMENLPMHWTDSLAIAKLFVPQLMQHCVNHLTTQVHCNVQGHTVLALRNNTDESITLPKHTRVGVLDLRSVGYFHKSRDELVSMFSEDYMFLSDEDTLEEMYQFCDKLRNFKPYHLRDPASMTTSGAKWALQDAVQQLRARERSQTEVRNLARQPG